MKTLKLTGIALFGCLAGAQAATVSTYDQDFNSYGVNLSDVAGQDDWTINNTTDQYSYVYTTFAAFGYGKAINLGDASGVATPPTPPTTVTLSHSYVGVMGGLELQFEYAILDSFADGFYNRDKFGVSVTVGATNLLEISFEPRVAQPVDPTLDAHALWDVNYTSAYGSGTLNMAFEENGKYNFVLVASPTLDGLSTSFTLSLDGGNTLSDSKTLTGLHPLTQTDTFNINWANVGSNAFGSNVIAMDNLNIIPESSTALLAGLASLGLLRRRRN